MTLPELLAGIPLSPEVSRELARPEITGIEYDSRKVHPGNLFFAFPGAKVDGREFAAQALEKGAVAVVSEMEAPSGFDGVWIRVPHGRQALAVASRRFYGNLDQKIGLTGITGTNGKTTTSYLIDSILRTAGYTTALVGTIEYRLGSKVLPAANTTPESLDLHRLLAELDGLGEAGPLSATMEISSHALALRRIYGIEFHTAVFTNLTRDHLDFHHTMEEYFAAKRLLFTGSGGRAPGYAVINRDDDYGRKLGAAASQSDVLWYGLGQDARVRARHIHSGFGGLRFELVYDRLKLDIESPLIGKINVYNILAASCAAMTYGISPEIIARGIAECAGVPGRFERVDEGQPFAVVVDYSHTDDALRNAISVARTLNPKRVITVFGCGGDRDRTKRPIMGQVAGELSDVVFVTSDNPRSEDPLQIMNDVLVGSGRTDTQNHCGAHGPGCGDPAKAIEEANAGGYRSAGR